MPGRPQRLQAEVQQLREVDRQHDCNTARNNVEVLGHQRPVWHLDAQGNKQYAEDADRDRAMSTARQQVSSNCNQWLCPLRPPP